MHNMTLQESGTDRYGTSQAQESDLAAVWLERKQQTRLDSCAVNALKCLHGANEAFHLAIANGFPDPFGH